MMNFISWYHTPPKKKSSASAGFKPTSDRCQWCCSNHLAIHWPINPLSHHIRFVKKDRIFNLNDRFPLLSLTFLSLCQMMMGYISVLLSPSPVCGLRSSSWPLDSWTQTLSVLMSKMPLQSSNLKGSVQDLTSPAVNLK